MPLSRRLDLPGRRLALDLSGPAPQVGVVLLHGYGASRQGTKVRHLVASLEAGGRAWAALDATAHGDSSGEAHELSIGRLADDLSAAVEHLAAEEGWSGRVVLAGSSMGGVAAAWAAADRLPETAALFLIAPAMRLVDRLLESLGPDQVDAWRESGRLPREHRGWNHELGWALVEDWQRRDQAALPSRLAMPITLVQGGADDRVPPADARAFCRAATQTRLVEVKGGDHRLHEHLPLLADELAALLERIA